MISAGRQVKQRPSGLIAVNIGCLTGVFPGTPPNYPIYFSPLTELCQVKPLSFLFRPFLCKQSPLLRRQMQIAVQPPDAVILPVLGGNDPLQALDLVFPGAERVVPALPIPADLRLDDGPEPLNGLQDALVGQVRVENPGVAPEEVKDIIVKSM